MIKIFRSQNDQNGFFLLEMLVVIVLFAILGMAIAQSAVLVEKNRTLSLHQQQFCTAP